MPKPVSIMHFSHKSNVDYALLQCLIALVEEAHVSRAAEQIGVGQPNMSRALKRLRETFDDPILVRAQRGWKPTVRAAELVHIARRILREIDLAVRTTQSFDPAEAHLQFQLVVTDYAQVVFMPALLALLAQEAPYVSVSFAPTVDPKTLPYLMENGLIDFAITLHPVELLDLRRVRLLRERPVCLVRQGHACLQGKMTLRRFLALPHVLISTSGKMYFAQDFDAALAKKKLQRTIAMTVPHYLPPAFLVAHTDMAVILPGRLAAEMCRRLPLSEIEIPFPMAEIDVSLYWHERVHNSPAHKWFRATVQRSVMAL
jgi:DNA-binding transcriptional LysR family regulator